MNAKTEKKSDDFKEQFMELQLIQQRMQGLSTQIQQFQIEKLEIENSLSELKSSDKSVYKAVGGILIEKTNSEIQKELNDRKAELDLSLRNTEKEEKSLRTKMDSLQKEIMSKLK